jgi:hypothetical protein
VAIDAQLDPTASARVRERRLEHAAKKIDYWQRRAEEATRHHRRRRRRDLRARGVDFRRVKRCPAWPILVELDLGVDPARAPFSDDLDVSL